MKPDRSLEARGSFLAACVAVCMAVVIACVHCHTIKLRWTESQRFHTNRQRSTTGCAPCSISTLATRAVRLTALRFRRPFLAKCNALHRQALCSSRTHVHVSSLAIAFGQTQLQQIQTSSLLPSPSVLILSLLRAPCAPKPFLPWRAHHSHCCLWVLHRAQLCMLVGSAAHSHGIASSAVVAEHPRVW